MVGHCQERSQCDLRRYRVLFAWSCGWAATVREEVLDPAIYCTDSPTTSFLSPSFSFHLLSLEEVMLSPPALTTNPLAIGEVVED
jgi:hypothetical protein